MSGHEYQHRRVLRMVRERGVLRPRELEDEGIPRHSLDVLYRRGKVERAGRGLYIPVDADMTENHGLVLACKRVPHGVVCLLSALRFHELTTQLPFEVWMMIDGKSRPPVHQWPPLRIMRSSGAALSFGVEEHPAEGSVIRVYSVAKTVADCFKYRNKVGLDVAIEALRDAWRGRRATMDQLWEAAKVCRMRRVMEPYLQSLI